MERDRLIGYVGVCGTGAGGGKKQYIFTLGDFGIDLSFCGHILKILLTSHYS